jgi:hypothetical protein
MLKHRLRSHPRNIKSVDAYVYIVNLFPVISYRGFIPASHIVGTTSDTGNSFLRESLALRG